MVKAEWPELFDECARAERYVRSDPRASVIYGRRVVEQVVRYLYEVATIPAPYQSDLGAGIGAAEFRNLVGPNVDGIILVLDEVHAHAAPDATVA